jgi:hypothetical protein
MYVEWVPAMWFDARGLASWTFLAGLERQGLSARAKIN